MFALILGVMLRTNSMLSMVQLFHFRLAVYGMWHTLVRYVRVRVLAGRLPVERRGESVSLFEAFR